MSLRSELHPIGAETILLNGTLAQMNAVTGAQGQSWYNTTYNAWFDWIVDRWLPRAMPDPRYGFVLYDEFLGTDRIGQLDWLTAGTAPAIQLSTSNVPGAFSIKQVATTTNSRIQMNTAGLQLGTMDLYLEASISIPTLATAQEDFSAAFGLNDGTAYDANSACTDGAYISINRAVNGAKWITNTTNGTTNTATNTTVADIVAGTQYRLGIMCTTTNVTFYQNGVLMATHSTNLPYTSSHQTGYCFRVDKVLGAGSIVSAINVDYFMSWGFFNGQRVA